MENKYSIAVLYICIGKYAFFWEEFYKSFEKNFLKESHVEYYVFTDAVKLYGEDCNTRIHKKYQENLGWPGNTLYRFKMFNSIYEELIKFDFCFFFNANIICKDKISEFEFLPIETDLLMVQHPGYYKSNKFKFPYEHNRKSKAYIPYGKGDVYVYGAINGGYTKPFLEMSSELEKNIEDDLQNGFIAKWHDESHLNCYIWKNKKYRLLNPAYAYPEGMNLPYMEKIEILDKASKIKLDKDKLFELEQKSVLKRIKRRVYKIWSRIKCQ